MTRKLEEAFREVSKLPAEEQDRFAGFVLSELESERRWDASFARSQGLLSRMAAKAREEDARGETLPLGSAGEIEND